MFLVEYLPTISVDLQSAGYQRFSSTCGLPQAGCKLAEAFGET